jgi:protein-tyrosine phosphatase
MPAGTRPRRFANWVVKLIASVAILASLYVAWDQATYNFGSVQPGRIYRSGQMPAHTLARTLRDYHVKTVLNLRGENLDESWYRDELKATRGAGVTHVDIAMSSCIWMSRVQLRALVDTIETAEYPLLIHCAWGSERTGLAAAFAELLRPGGTLADARAQFSLRYLFVRVNDGKMMAEHLDQYERWLLAHHLEHDPANFRRWVNDGFQPGMPGREEWLYDPYPLVVVRHADETSRNTAK